MIGLVICPSKGRAPYPPLAVASLKSWLSKHGIKSKAIDLNKSLCIENPLLYDSLNDIFGRPSTHLYNLPNEQIFNIDTIYNARLLFNFLGLVSFKLDSNQSAFFSQLKKQIKTDAEKLINEGFTAVGFSCYVSNIPYSMLLASELKRHDSNIKVFFGGPSISYNPIRNFLLSYHIADYVLVGEGEEAILKLATDLRHNNLTDYNTIYSNNIAPAELLPNEITVNTITDLDELPFPDFSDFNINNYQLEYYPSYKFATIASSRGCVNRCDYCSETQFWKRYRRRNVEKVIEEIKYQYHHGYSIFFFCDSLINGDIKWITEFCEELVHLDLPIMWMSYATINNLNKPLLDLMTKSGCVALTLGVEHISKRVLKSVNKTSSIGHTVECLQNCIQADIFPIANLIYGIPGESDEDFCELLNFMTSPKLFHRVCFTFRPYEIRVGSKLSERLLNELKEFKYHSFPEDTDDLITNLYLYWNPSQDYMASIKVKARILMAMRIALDSNKNTSLDNAREYNILPLLNHIVRLESIPQFRDTPDYVRMDSLTNNVILYINGKNTLGVITNLIFQEIPKILISKYDKNENELKNILYSKIKRILISLTQKGYIIWH